VREKRPEDLTSLFPKDSHVGKRGEGRERLSKSPTETRSLMCQDYREKKKKEGGKEDPGKKGEGSQGSKELFS